MLKFQRGDELLIDFDYRTIKGIVANGLDNMDVKKDSIKVILEGDNSYNPISIPIKRIMKINGKEVTDARPNTRDE